MGKNVAVPAAEVRNPLFARLMDRLSAREEKSGGAEHRRELLAGLSGRVVEVGAGNGVNFKHYPATVDEVVAVEPEPYLRARAEEEAGGAPVRVSVVAGLADELPLEDGSADAVVVSLVLCTVPSQASALAEVRRVLKPGGELRFYEHVLAEEPKLARAQRVATRSRIWPLVGGGCHADRATPEAIEAAGFEMESCRRFDFRPSVLVALAAPHVLGVARRP